MESSENYIPTLTKHLLCEKAEQENEIDSPGIEFEFTSIWFSECGWNEEFMLRGKGF